MSLRALRVLAVALAVVPGLGTGHLVLGRARRALVWFVAPAAVMTLLWAFFPALARFMGLRAAVALAVSVGGVLLVAGPLDAARLRPGSTEAPRALVLGLYAAAALAASFALRAMASSAFEVRVVPSMAMAPTLAPGDHVAVDRRRRTEPALGDLVLFRHPKTEAPFLGRVIAREGARVSLERGRVQVDGKEIPSCLVSERFTIPGGDEALDRGALRVEARGGATFLSFVSARDEAQSARRTFEVPQGSVFVLGDHRSRSEDSREFGPIATERILGTAAYFAGRSSELSTGLTFGARLDQAEPTSLTPGLAPQVRGCSVALRP